LRSPKDFDPGKPVDSIKFQFSERRGMPTLQSLYSILTAELANSIEATDASCRKDFYEKSLTF
jgi:hypothetical protein